MILPLFSLKDGVYFPSPWIWLALSFALAQSMWQKWPCAISSLGPKRPGYFHFLEPWDHHAMKKLGLACWRMGGHVEENHQHQDPRHVSEALLDVPAQASY